MVVVIQAEVISSTIWLEPSVKKYLFIKMANLEILYSNAFLVDAEISFFWDIYLQRVTPLSFCCVVRHVLPKARLDTIGIFTMKTSYTI